MSNLFRRLRKLEEHLTDPSGLVPHSQRWLEYWDREIFNFMTAPDGTRPAVLFPLEAFSAVMKYVPSPTGPPPSGPSLSGSPGRKADSASPYPTSNPRTS